MIQVLFMQNILHSKEIQFQSLNMKILFWAILTYFLNYTIQIDSKFGLLTFTQSANKDYSTIEKYLKIYAQTQCYTEIISEINIVWSNELLPQQTSILSESSKWNVPVYFYMPTFDSIDHRFRLPKKSTANLFYSLNDDILIDCQTFRATFEEYRKLGADKLGKILTNQVRGFKFQPSSLQYTQFLYQNHQTANYFTISQIGLAYIPRQYLQLYYLRIIEFLQLRNEVLDFKNCEDIFFYTFVQHFYPQSPAVYVQSPKIIRNNDSRKGQNKNAQKIRCKCITDISKYLGYNPLRYYHKSTSLISKNWKYGNRISTMILEQKQRGLSEIEIQKGFQKNVSEYLQNKEKIIKQQQLLQKRRKEIEWSENKLKEKQQGNETDVQVKQNQQSKLAINANKNDGSNELERQQKQIIPSFQFTYLLEIISLLILIMLLSFAVIKLYKKNCNRKKKHRIHIKQEEQTQFSIIKLSERY